MSDEVHLRAQTGRTSNWRAILSQWVAMKRRIEIMAFERERIVRRSAPTGCPVCDSTGGLLTTTEAAALARVKVQSVYRWLTQGKAHGVKTCGGQHRICKNSIFKVLP